MSEKMPCELIQDLLPSYHDKLTSDTTNRIVETHLDECSVCSEMLRDMDAPIVAEENPAERSSPVIDFLRKARRVERWKMIACCALAVVICCVGVKFCQYKIGHNVSDAVSNLNITVDGNTIYVDGAMESPNYSVANVGIRSQAQKSKTGDYLSGYYTVIVYGGEYRKSDDGSVAEFHAEKTVKNSVKGVYLGGTSSSELVWSGGEMISYRVGFFYDSVKDFMADSTGEYVVGMDYFDLAELSGKFTQTLDDPENPKTLLITLDQP